MLTNPYVVDWFNDYSSNSDFVNPGKEGKAIDKAIENQFTQRHPKMIKIERQQDFSIPVPLKKLTQDNLPPIQADVAFIGAIRKNENQFTIELRVYSKEGKYLSDVIKKEIGDRGEIAREYHHLAIKNFPFSGVVTGRVGQKLEIALKAGIHLNETLIANRKWRVAGDKDDFEFARLSLTNNQLTVYLNSTWSRIQRNTVIVGVVRLEKKLADKLTVMLIGEDNSKLKNYQIWAGSTKGNEKLVGYTDSNGEIDLSPLIQGDKTIYVTVKKATKIVETFETSANKGPIHHVKLKIKKP